MPIARPRNYKPGQLQLPETEWTASRIQENEFINRIRGRVAIWRKGGYVGITKTTARLIEHWRSADRERRLFFCQIEALETLIYITEVAGKYGDAWIENDLRRHAQEANPDLFRLACKMATGGDEPYEKLKRTLRPEIDEAAWSSLYSAESLPFDTPATGKIAIKVINHYGDEVLKVYPVA